MKLVKNENARSDGLSAPREVFECYDEGGKLVELRTTLERARYHALRIVADAMRVKYDGKIFKFYSREQVDLFHERVGEVLRVIKDWTA